MCRELAIAPSTYYAQQQRAQNPERCSARQQCDQQLCQDIERIWRENHGVYGARKVWHALRREGIAVARCTVERLMRQLGLQGAVRGKKVITTKVDTALPCPQDKVNRQFRATRPNQLWISDFTYVSSHQGMVYVAFVIDVFARKIVGWRVSTSMTTSFVLDALNQAIATRLPKQLQKKLDGNALIHHSDRGSQYLAIAYSDRLLEANIDASVGTTGDSYDNAMAETIIGLFKTEVIKRHAPWKSAQHIEWATLKWVHWFNHQRLLQPIGYITPTEAEDYYYENLKNISTLAA